MGHRPQPERSPRLRPLQVATGGRSGARLTHLDRVFWPESGLTKGDLVAYYRAVAPVLLPHLRDRPFTIKRHYTVPRGPFVWEKDAPAELPGWIRTCELPARSRGGAPVRYPLLNDEDALLWMLEYGCIDLHVTAARCDRPDRPDYVVFDLDPAGVAFGEVADAALVVRQALEALELESVVRTSGGEGLHVLVPIARRHTHEQARELAQVVARAVARSWPDLVTIEAAKARRHGVYVDTKMNGRAQQFVCVYSVRPVPSATVAAPLSWEEVAPDLDPRAFTMARVAERAARHGDMHAALLRGRQRLDGALRRFSSRSA